MCISQWVNQGDVLNAQLSTTKFRSVSSMGYYFSAMAGLSTWEYVYNTDPACIYNGMCLYDLPLEAQKAFLGIEACIWSEHEDENTLDKYWTNMALLGERLWSQNVSVSGGPVLGGQFCCSGGPVLNSFVTTLWSQNTILAHGDQFPPNFICEAENKTKPGCCIKEQQHIGFFGANGCATGANPSVNSRMLKHRCRLEQRGFRPMQYSTDILAFQSKWNQCASWLPPVSARNEHPRLPTPAMAAEGALLDRLEAAGVNASDVEAVKEALVARARAAGL